MIWLRDRVSLCHLASHDFHEVVIIFHPVKDLSHPEITASSHEYFLPLDLFL
jgi:hypothetical protein